ncbi:MAG: type II secretion system F family protein [Chloroflexi bacterium]|nr:type II secretion system F family protein [Chloroflexota bacterium]
MATLAFFAILLLFLGLHRVLSVRIDVSQRLGLQPSRPLAHPAQSTPSSPIAARIEKSVAGSGFAANIARDLARANLQVTVAEYLMLNAVTVVSLPATAYVISHNPGLALIAAVVGFYLPRMYVNRRQRARLKSFNDQLGDTILLVANSLRSGYGLLQSLELVARESPEPTREEFGRVVREVNLGLSPEDALANLVRRMNSEDLDLMVNAVNIQHEVGGNLAQILDSIATTIRERIRIKGEIRALTAQQTASGYVISFLPIGLGGILFLLNSRYMMQLFSTDIVICFPVIALPICSGILILLGFVAIRRIVNIEV